MRHVQLAFGLLLLASGAADAQGGRGRRGGFAAGDSMGRPPQREARLAIAKLIRAQVQTTDAQMQQLQALDRRFQPQREKLVGDEMTLRRQLRQAMLDTANVDQAKIGQLLDQLVTFPAKHAALMESEQKELASILTPLQRAKYQAIQEGLRRRIEQGRGGPPPKRPPA